MCKIWQYPQQVRIPRFTSSQKQSSLRRHSTLIIKVNLPFSDQLSHFLPQPAFSMSSLASLSSFELQPRNLMPFLRHDHPLSSTHGHTNEHCLPLWLHCYYGFIQTQHEHQIRRSFSVVELLSTHSSYRGSFCLL